MASPPNTPPNSTPPSVTSSPSNHRFFGFPNPRSATFSLCKDSSPTTRSQPPVSPRAEQESDPQDEDDDSDVEIYLSALSINNSIEDPTSISLGSIDNPIADHEQSTVPTPLRSNVRSQSQSLPQFNAPVQKTIPPHCDLGSPSHPHSPSKANRSGESKQPFSKPPVHTALLSYPEPGPGSTSSASTSLETLKTSNVYINGLPPHFPEDQLFALAAPYGPIRSVRTFTRHVRDNESGYGFVLFETVEAAEKCIQSLRRYRNLHPTFSKTVHKIPGTYSHTQLDLHPDDIETASGHASPVSTAWDQGGRLGSHSELGEDASFKAKMESLHDPTSTNLYMEGLPLSIDEPTLAALVSPHRISSSRFFQTRLSNPPRIIAFVRFETRKGAEEIIERLHGRMVRGWNDAGSRISVRFADTAEQRELRRTERSNRDGEQSPARLTIAQASLLNLRGQDLKSKSSLPLSRGGSSLPPPPPPSSLPPPPIVLDRPSLSPYNYEYRTSPIHSHSPLHTPPFGVDCSLAPGRGHGPLAPLSRTQTPVRLHGSPYHSHAALPTPLPVNEVRLPPPIDPAMTALLDSLRGGGVPFHPSPSATTALGAATGYGGTGVMAYNDVGHNPAHHAFGFGNAHFNSNLHALASNPQSSLSGYDATYAQNRATQARSGYTATEEFIMRAHGEAQQQQYDLRQEQQLRLRQEQILQQQLRHEPQPYQRRRPPALELAQQQQQRRRADSDASIGGIGVGVRGYRTQAAAITIPGSGAAHGRHLHPGLPMQHDGAVASPMSVMSPLPSMHEDEFHSTPPNDFRQAHQYQQQQVGDSGRISGAGVKHGHNHRIHPAHVNSRLSRDHNAPIQQQQQKQQPHQFQHAQQQSFQQQQYNSPQQHHHQSQLQSQQQEQPQSPCLFSQAPSPNPNLHHYQQAHLRSMTLPQRRPPSASAQRHYQHNSMSVTVPTSSSLTAQQRTFNANMTMANVLTNDTDHQNGHGCTNAPGIATSDSTNTGPGADAVDIYDGSTSSDGVISVSKDNLHFDSSQRRLQNPHHHFESSRTSSMHHHSQQHQNVLDSDFHQHHHHHQNQISPSLNELASPTLTTSSSLELISPALTYSVHTPASTLSPATPFFGSFANANGGHQGTAEHGKVQETAVRVVGMGVTGMGDADIE